MVEFPIKIPTFTEKDTFRDEIDPTRETEFINGRDLNQLYDEVVAIARNLGNTHKFEPILSGTILQVLSGTSCEGLNEINFLGDFATITGSAVFWVDSDADLQTGIEFPTATHIPVCEVNVSGSELTLIDRRIFVNTCQLAAEFGKSSDYAESETEAGFFFSSPSGTYSEALKLSTVTLSGTHRIGYSYEFTGNLIGPQNISVRVQIDDSDTISELERAVVLESGSWNLGSGFKQLSLGSGSHDIDIDIRADSISGTAFIRRARIEIWQVP